MPPTLSLERRLLYLSKSNKCAFCHTTSDDEMLCGKLLRTPGEPSFVVHHFCMLLSSGLRQGGDDDSEGIMGFVVKDILREIRRGERLNCSYCKRPGATIGCVVENCMIQFHLPCGLKYGSFHYFKDIFESFCEDHAPMQPPPKRTRLTFEAIFYSTCQCCREPVPARASRDVIRTACCPLQTRWYHKACVQKLAISAGLAHFQCPFCRAQSAFINTALDCGIYIPDRDASWELEAGAFQDQYQRRFECSAPVCLCTLEGGRRYCDDSSADWDIFLCHECGINGTHLRCSKITEEHINDERWNFLCDVCTNTGVVKCIAVQCKCAQGTKFSDEAEWKLIVCEKCLYNAVHSSCLGQLSSTFAWTCGPCRGEKSHERHSMQLAIQAAQVRKSSIIVVEKDVDGKEEAETVDGLEQEPNSDAGQVLLGTVEAVVEDRPRPQKARKSLNGGTFE